MYILFDPSTIKIITFNVIMMTAAFMHDQIFTLFSFRGYSAILVLHLKKKKKHFSKHKIH